MSESSRDIGAVQLEINMWATPRSVCWHGANVPALRSRVEEKLAHLAGHIAGDRCPLRPCKRLLQISGFQYPEPAHVLLGLDVGSVGDEYTAVGLLPQRLRAGGRGNSAGKLPGSGSDQFAVERVNLFHHRLGYGGRVKVVGEVVA